MNEGKISIRYARALYAMAIETKTEKAIYDQIFMLSNAYFHMPALKEALSNPIYTKEQKLNLLNTASGPNTPKPLEQFFKFVLDKGREEYMLFMCMSFQDIFRKEQRMVIGELISAVPLDDKIIARIKKYVMEKYNQSLELTVKIDPTLIGGFIIEVNNQKMDASIKAELKRIQLAMTA